MLSNKQKLTLIEELVSTKIGQNYFLNEEIIEIIAGIINNELEGYEDDDLVKYYSN